MPRNMSFAMTKQQVRDKSKTVTRRFAWLSLKPGSVVQPVEKAMGFKKGEKVVYIGDLIRVKCTCIEPLNAITQEDVVKEGFPNMTPPEFVSMLCTHYKCPPDKPINRIEFEYL